MHKMTCLIAVHIDVTELMHGAESNYFVMLGTSFKEFGRVNVFQVFITVCGEICIHNKEGAIYCLEG